MGETVFHWPIRVYFEDTDAQGVVYFANYLKFAERARTEWLRQLDIESSVIKSDHLGFVVTRIEADYKGMAHLDDQLVVETMLMDMGASRLVLKQDIKRDGIALVNTIVHIIVIDTRTQKPVRIPVSWRQRI